MNKQENDLLMRFAQVMADESLREYQNGNPAELERDEVLEPWVVITEAGKAYSAGYLAITENDLIEYAEYEFGLTINLQENQKESQK